MSDSPNRQAVIVGMFVALGVAFLGGGIITVGSMSDTFSRKIRVSVVFDQVNGLQPGNNIWFSGVKVGTVKRVRFHEGSDVAVDMAIDRDASQYIRKDALAKVSSDGLIGNKIVVLYEGTPGADAIEDGDQLEPGVAVTTEDMMAMFQVNNENLLAITTDIKGLTAKIAAGEGSVGKILHDDALYTDLTTTIGSLRSAAANAEELTGSLSTFTASLNQPGTLPHDLIHDKQTYASLTASVGELKEATEGASGMITDLRTAVANPNTPLGTLMRDEDAGADLAAVLENLDRTTVLLNEDLEAAQHSILLRGFFRKRDKAEEDADEPAP